MAFSEPDVWLASCRQRRHLLRCTRPDWRSESTAVLHAHTVIDNIKYSMVTWHFYFRFISCPLLLLTHSHRSRASQTSYINMQINSSEQKQRGHHGAWNNKLLAIRDKTTRSKLLIRPIIKPTSVVDESAAWTDRVSVPSSWQPLTWSSSSRSWMCNSCREFRWRNSQTFCIAHHQRGQCKQTS